MAAGEIGPPLWNRTDLSWHNSAAKELENFIPTPWGPVVFSAGLRFVAEVDDSAKLHRLTPFRFSVADAYMLILGDLTMRFGRAKGIVENPPGTPVSIVTPWVSADLAQIRTTQDKDVLYMVHHGYDPVELRRASHTSWTIPEFDFKDGPYYAENTTTRTLALSGTTGSVTATLSNADAVNNGQGFLATDVGRLFRWKDPANNWTWLEITARASTVSVTATIRGADASAGTATAAWRMGLWSDTTGWPAATVFYQGRLWFGTNPLWSLPRLDGSNSGDFPNFAPSLPNGTIADNHAVSKLIGAGELNTIHDLKSVRDLIVFTAGRDFRVTSGRIDEPITPLNIEAFPLTAHGTADVEPVEAFNSVLFAQRDGATLRQFGYAIEQDGYTAKDQTIRAPHIGHSGPADVDGGFSQIAYAQSPMNQALVVRGDGVMPGFTFLPEQEVFAWMRHARAPTNGGTTTAFAPSAIESAAVIPYNKIDQPWVIVRRTIGGVTKRYVEILEQPLGDDDPIEDAFYLDSGLTLDNTGTLIGYGTLTPGVGANVVDTVNVTFTASTGGFTSAHVGRKLLYRYKDTATYPPYGRHPIAKHIVWKTAMAEITARDSATLVRCTIRAAFPSLAAIAATDWRLTVLTVSGLAHMNGESVAVWGDGAPQDAKVVSAGAITLESEAATVQVGLAYTGRFDPILTDIKGASRHGTRQKIVSVSLDLWRSVGGRVRIPAKEDGETAPPAEQIPYRFTDAEMASPIQPFSGWTEKINVPDGWDENPMLLIEQDLAGPMQIRGIKPVFESNA